MSLLDHQTPTQNHQATAQKLIDQSIELKQLFQDQWFYVWDLTPKNLFVIDQNRHQLSVANGLLYIIFDENQSEMIKFVSSADKLDVQGLADFIFHDITFLIRDLKAQHTLFLQTKVQLFRQLIVEEVFKWVDGENRIEQFLYNLNTVQATQLDQIMMDAGYYDEPYLSQFAHSGKEIPLDVEMNFKHLSLVNSVMGNNFLPVQQLIPIYDQFCFSAHLMMSPALYRIVESAFDEQFTLAQVMTHQNEFQLLTEHAQQQPHLLALSQWIKRGYWQYKDIFSKKNFLQAGSIYWDERISHQFPLFYYKRNVSWLFKQHAHVIDWVSKHLDNINVRIAVTALSFVDTSQVHPQVILQSLKYFDSIAAHLLITDLSHYAQKADWFLDQEDSNNSKQIVHPYRLRPLDHSLRSFSPRKIEIAPSVLYAEEWLNLLFYMSKDNQRVAKQVYHRLSRVIQAYMLFLQKIIQHIPNELIAFIDPQLQQDPRFFTYLKKNQIDVQQFRAYFKHPTVGTQRASNVFDSYVADYLVDVFNEQSPLSKNLTWSGLYQQAVRWHQQIHFDDTLSKLKRRISVTSWKRISPQEIMFMDHWKFEELNSLESIIHESIHFKHCLALSYSERIAAGDYVAFHMTHLNDQTLSLTLGCFYKFDQLHFDQLRLPNNEIAPVETERDAKAFIHKVNQHLIWDFKEPKVE